MLHLMSNSLNRLFCVREAVTAVGNTSMTLHVQGYVHDNIDNGHKTNRHRVPIVRHRLNSSASYHSTVGAPTHGHPGAHSTMVITCTAIETERPERKSF